MTALAQGLLRWWPALALGPAVLLAIFLGWSSLQRNFRAACERQEWPYFSSCPALNEAVPMQVSRLRARIAGNPGDSAAWVALALLTLQPGGVAPLDDEAVLGTAVRLAGNDALLLRVQAARAMEREQWPQAVGWLVKLVQDNADADAARALAALVPVAPAQAALSAALQPGTTWLEPVLGQLGRAGVPALRAMPLVKQALPLKLVSPKAVQTLMRALKAGGHWLEAHGLWIWLVGAPVPLIYNGDFEQGFISDGFDWEPRDIPASKTGALLAQPQLARQGRVLQVEFTGRQVALPVLRQTLVLPDGAYVFDGQYMSNRLRSLHGLAWTFNCANGGRELARTPPLMDTRGQWRALNLELSVPPECGGAVALQLQTQVGSEALAGLRGLMNFDAFRLTAR